MGVPAERIHVVPNWMDERLVYPVEHDKNPFRKSQGWTDKFVVLYSGNMGFSHYFDDILSVADQLRDHEKIVLVFIGDGSRQSEVRAWARDRALTNVVLLPFQDISVLAQSLSAGDLHLVTLRESCTGLSVPSKSYGILAAGRPILYQGSQRGEIARMIVEEDVGTVVPCGDVERLRNAILKYASQTDLCQTQGRKARALAEGAYGRRRALERYAEALGIAPCRERASRSRDEHTYCLDDSAHSPGWQLPS
jgi:glycosyltransferase involved in cell wall biosynthesis